MFIWAVLNDNAKQAKTLWRVTEICLNPKSLLKLLKSFFTQRNLAQTFPHGPMIWKVMRRNAWKDIENWRTKQLNGYNAKSQHHALTNTNSRKKKWDLSENCQRFAHKIVFFLMLVFGPHWVDLIFYGL